MRNPEQEVQTDSLVDEYPHLHLATIAAVRKLYADHPNADQLVRERLEKYVRAITTQVIELRSVELQSSYREKFSAIDGESVVAILNRHADELEKKMRLACSPDLFINFVLKELYDRQEQILYSAALEHYKKLKEEGKIDFSALNSQPSRISILWRKVKRIFV